MNYRSLFSRFVALLIIGSAAAGPLVALESQATRVLLLDVTTNTVLLEKNANVPAPPASMSKLMTLYMLFERIADGGLKLTDTFSVSEKAWRMGGSKMFVRVNSEVTIEDLIRGIVVQSGNDACIVVGEGLAGSEEAFAEQMTRRGREIGLENSTFKNASGWPDVDHLMSARDLAVLANRLITEFPQYYGYFSEKSFTYNKIRQGNRNPLLYKAMNADGLKTGHTSEAGYGMVASTLRNDRRLILVLGGLGSVNQRAREAERLLNWGYREFGNYDLFNANEVVSQADVWLGTESEVPLVIRDELTITITRKARRALKVSVVYDGPLAAPIGKGDKVAELHVTGPDTADISIPLFAGTDVNKLGMFGRLQAAVSYLMWGSNP
jgi:D-alanyl-D-alanine carboxypeptidase (penicillin-binding protein 5/6)